MKTYLHGVISHYFPTCSSHTQSLGDLARSHECSLLPRHSVHPCNPPPAPTALLAWNAQVSGLDQLSGYVVNLTVSLTESAWCMWIFTKVCCVQWMNKCCKFLKEWLSCPVLICYLMKFFLESHRRSCCYTLIAVLTLHWSMRLMSSFMADWKSHMFITQL